jgi:predicted aspartyl protease
VAAVIRKTYLANSAYLRAFGVVTNPVNGRQVPFNTECLVDTGFYGGIFLPNSFMNDARSIGVEPVATPVTLADGNEIIAHVCAGYLQRLEDHDLGLPGKPIFIVISENASGDVLGMDTLQHFTILFDGPNQHFILTL